MRWCSPASYRTPRAFVTRATASNARACGSERTERAAIDEALSSPVLPAKQRQQNWDHHLIACTAGAALDGYEICQAHQSDLVCFVPHDSSTGQELGVTAAIVKPAEYVERPEPGGEQDLACSGEQGLVGPEVTSRRIPNSSVEGPQCFEQPDQVRARLLGDDVEIQCRYRSTVEHRRRAANDDEVDPPVAQDREQLPEVSAGRV